MMTDAYINPLVKRKVVYLGLDTHLILEFNMCNLCFSYEICLIWISLGNGLKDDVLKYGLIENTFLYVWFELMIESI